MHASHKDTTYTKIFVGGLPYHSSDSSLRRYFEMFGEIDEAVVITDRQTGKSRGYGFVTMAEQTGAERACKEPNPIIDGRKANVNLAYLGAKPRLIHTGLSFGIPQLHPAFLQRPYGFPAHYLYPQAYLQLPHMQPTAGSPANTTPYLDYSSLAYSQYSVYEQYPYAASPAPPRYAFTLQQALGAPAPGANPPLAQ